jgi:hypothetical protein
MSGKALIVVVMGLIVISSMIFLNIKLSSNRITANYNEYYMRQSAQNIAQSGVNLALVKLASDRTWRAGIPLTSILGGRVKVTVTDSTYLTKKVIKVFSVGTMDYPTGILEYNSKPSRIDTAIALVPPGMSPSVLLKGLVTARTDVAVNGNLTIDARDHTVAGALLPATGTIAVWTTKTFSPGGSSQTGGTAAGVDYVPAGSPNPNVIKANQPAANFPGSPDSVMGGAANGFSEGTLKAIAKSGVGGSQYSVGGAGLKNPIQGVTYIEGDFGGSWTGSGILIIHNSTNSAVYKNTSGNFTGLLIVDDLVHVHSNLTGAAVVLTSNPSSGNVLGNGNGTMLYSGAAVSAALNQLQSVSNGSAAMVLAWKE